VLERSNEEGSPLRRALCSGLSAHAVFAALTRQAQLDRFIRHRAGGRKIECHDGGAVQGSAWLAAGCLGDLTTRQREVVKNHIRGRGRTVRTACSRVVKCIAEVGGRRCGPEKRRRSAPLTRRSGVCVAGGLARTNCCSILHGETCGEAFSDRASKATSRVESRRQSRGIDQRRRQP
jgi:hypothetical protein